MSNYFESEGPSGLEYVPFDDAREANRYIASSTSAQSGSGMDTTAFDNWRQGVELTIPKYLYGSVLPKIWAGNLNHFIKIVTYGQARSWTEHDGLKYRADQSIEFNSLQYIQVL